jgi:acetoin utilization deacetylase AcuC-like enzyme
MSKLELGELTPEVVKELEEKYLSLAHSKDHIDYVKQKCDELDNDRSFADQKKDIYLSKKSYEAACLSALSTIRGV